MAEADLTAGRFPAPNARITRGITGEIADMGRGLAWIVIAAVLLLSGPGCGFRQQDNTTLPSGHNHGTAQPAGELHSGGEADPARMTLGMKKWTWIRTLYNNDTIIVPAKPGAFTLAFNSDGHVSVATDCNRMGGGYTVYENRLSFSELSSTRMHCPDSQEDVFADMLSNVSSFLFTPRGELVLELKFDSGHILLK
jgi:heat shock protein HslJ